MLVLVATNELQGAEVGDIAGTVEGELVTPVAAECAGVGCGCRRGFPGLASGASTTTAMIVERPGVTHQDLRDAVRDWLDRAGWIELLERTATERSAAVDHDGVDPRHLDEVDQLVEDLIDEHVERIAEVCACFPEGTVVGRLGRHVWARSLPTAA